MTGLRGSDLDEDDGGGDEHYSSYTFEDSTSGSLVGRKQRKLWRDLQIKTPPLPRVGNPEQRVSMLENLLQSVADLKPITTERESGEWFAHDPETGCAGNGETRAEALSQLAEAIAHESGEISYTDEFADDVSAGQRQVAAGDTTSADDVRSRLGIDD